jgi:hypothetical protein
MIPQPIILGAENRFIFADLAIPLDHQIVGIPLKETSSEFHRLYLARIAHKSLQICERCTLWQPRMLLFGENSLKQFVLIHLFCGLLLICQ